MNNHENEVALSCISCRQDYHIDEVRYKCDCGGLIEIRHNISKLKKISTRLFDDRLSSLKTIDRSGVWRFREALTGAGENDIVTHPEGATRLYHRSRLSDFAGVDEIHFKHEGENPTGSFKDRGMSAAVTQAKILGKKLLACASTGNTSASLAAYAAGAGLEAIVFLPNGKVALGKVAQAIGYGARCLGIRGDFDDAMRMVNEAKDKFGIYMVNSLNPFRLEGQKTIMWEMLQDLGWNTPDWVVVPGGNLGNTSAFGKALIEAYNAGWIKRLPRIATIQASGANPFYQSFADGFKKPYNVKAETIATAIRIGNPVNFDKARRVITELGGVVSEVADSEILEAKSAIDRVGIGCEPASACSLAGARKLRAQGVIRKSDRVVCILTGHILKDPDTILSTSTNEIREIDATMDAVGDFLGKI
ncbi:MAG: threonine synthase [Oligoflexales bacterium]|nr:threonine synthase [Oligoflexales bacterium]